MGVNHFEHIPAWVARVADRAPGRTTEQVLDDLLESLQEELHARCPATEFGTYRHRDNLFVEWRGTPNPLSLADLLGVDTYHDDRGLENAMLWFSDDLPEPVDGARVLLKHID